VISVSGFDRYIDLYRQEFLLAIDEAITSKQLILGPIVERFEEQFASYVGTSYACAVNSGTDALNLAVRVLGVSEGKLLSVSNAGPYASIAAVENGLIPIFCDVNYYSRLIDVDSLIAKLDQNPDTRVVVLTHLFGSPIPSVEAIVDELHRRKIWVVEDCSQAHGAEINGRKVGTFGDLAVFSFDPTKNLGALGDAGVVLTSSAFWNEKLRSLRQYGWGERYLVKYSGGVNSRMDALQASVLGRVLPHLDSWNATRQQIASVYQELISQPEVSKPLFSTDSVFHLYTITCEKRDDLMAHLRKRGIESTVHYPTLDHQRFSHINTELPIAQKLRDRILSIPCNPFLLIEEASLISDTINSFK
jgi:aminotransferase EvaB